MAVNDITVAIATFQRPQQLRELLSSLEGQQLNPRRTMRVVVVDNDPEMSAEPVCQQATGDVTYAHEPVPGISPARNCALRLATGSDAVAFIDDDERAHPIWLEALATAAEDFDADVVAGPVVPVFPVNAPRWIIRQGWFERTQYVTGQDVKWPATNNSLIRRRTLDLLAGEHFDPRLGLTGGEDTDFYLRCRERGARFVWAQDALVTESVAAPRLTARWLWRRGVRLGNVSGTTLGRRHSTALVLTIGVGRVLYGLLAAPIVLIFRQPAAARVIGHIPRGIGVITGLLGAPLVEYSRPTSEGKRG